jgi:hypothetical protein
VRGERKAFRNEERGLTLRNVNGRWGSCRFPQSRCHTRRNGGKEAGLWSAGVYKGEVETPRELVILDCPTFVFSRHTTHSGAVFTSMPKISCGYRTSEQERRRRQTTQTTQTIQTHTMRYILHILHRKLHSILHSTILCTYLHTEACVARIVDLLENPRGK